MSKKITTASFIAKAREIHCDRYSYDKTVSVSDEKNVIGTCPTHGDFNTYPSNHTHKSQPKGCWDCGGPKSLTWEKFVFAQSQKLRAGGSVFSEQAISTFTLGFTSQPTASVQALTIACSAEASVLLIKSQADSVSLKKPLAVASLQRRLNKPEMHF